MLAGAAAIGLFVGVGHYKASWSLLLSEKAKERATILRLAGAFVGAYSETRRQHMRADAPVPATFRARAMQAFNASAPASNALRLDMVGFPGRAVEREPTDAALADVIRSFVGAAPEAASYTLDTPQGPVLRTVYPSIANKESCVSCHNALQPATKGHWRLGDVMGAYVIDAPMGGAVAILKRNAIAAALGAFIVLAGMAAIFMREGRRTADREPVARLPSDSGAASSAT